MEVLTSFFSYFTPWAAQGVSVMEKGKADKLSVAKAAFHTLNLHNTIFFLPASKLFFFLAVYLTPRNDLADSAWTLFCWVTSFSFQIKRPIIACIWRFRQLLPFNLSMSCMWISCCSVWKAKFRRDCSERLNYWMSCPSLHTWSQGSRHPGPPVQDKPCWNAAFHTKHFSAKPGSDARSQLQLGAGMYLTSGKGQPGSFCSELFASHIFHPVLAEPLCLSEPQIPELP